MKRPFKIKGGIVIGIVAILVALFFIILYLPVGSSSLTGVEWIIVAAWIVVGLIFYLYSIRRKVHLSAECQAALYNNEDTFVKG